MNTLKEDIVKQCLKTGESVFVSDINNTLNNIKYKGLSLLDNFMKLPISEKKEIFKAIHSIDILQDNTKDKIILKLINDCYLETSEEYLLLTNDIDYIFKNIKEDIVVMTMEKRKKNYITMFSKKIFYNLGLVFFWVFLLNTTNSIIFKFLLIVLLGLCSICAILNLINIIILLLSCKSSYSHES